MQKVAMKRRSCDRCYSHKVGCQRGQDDSCERCIKVNAPCIWGNSKRLRKAPSGELGFPPSENLFSDMNLDEFSMFENWVATEPPGNSTETIDPEGIQQIFGTDAERIQIEGNLDMLIENGLSEDNLFETGITGSVTGSTEMDKAERLVFSALSQLSQLNPQLYALHMEILRRQKRKAISNHDLETSLDETEGNLNSPIDKTFQLSQELVKLLNNLTPCFLEKPNSTIPDGHVEILDDDSILLILVIYTRVISIYIEIFSQVQSCLDDSKHIHETQYLKAPSVTIGQFSAPISSSLHILMLIQLSSQFLDRLRDLTCSICTMQAQPNQDDEDGEFNSVIHMLQYVKRQEKLSEVKKAKLLITLNSSKVL